jgi:methylphosphotriester-DNA--protein-cysteine methyltransferase
LGYNDSWIEKRLQSIGIRGQLTDEWKERDVKEGLEFAILTAEISKASFGMTPSEYKKHKGLKRENLRDHMTNLELIFTMLGEEQTQIEAINKDAQGFNENKQAAQKAGKATGKALETFEQETNQKIVSEMNYLKQIEEAKKQKKLDDKIEDD